MITRPDIDGVLEWIRKNGENIQFAILLKMPGSADGLTDQEV